jgi:WD40 repeat protein/ABC-type dipeptide/oligopeptide/nickel transport system ATPase component
MSKVRYTVNPFPGIRNFEPDEDYLFFGRTRQIEEVSALLSATRFLALIGYSGSGKSSLVKAGIIPAITRLKAGTYGGGNWSTIYFRPDNNPFHSFAEALINTLGDNAYADELQYVKNTADHLKSNVINLEQVYQQYRSEEQENWLIVIDQFEEIFRFHSNANATEEHEDSQAFINLLLSGLQNTSLPVYIMVSMRSDFLDNCTEFDGLPNAINMGSYLLPKISNAGIRDTIIKPIETCNASISSELVERLMNDLNDNLDQLPVLQHAMMRTWDYWKQHESAGTAIDLPHYEAIGTMSAALSIHAEEIYSSLGERKQKVAEKIFKALTDVTVNSKGTRRPAQLWELMDLANASEQEVVDVIDEFRAPGRAFLMPVYTVGLEENTIIDIAHESLMRVWTRLKDWVYAEEKSAELYMRLSKSADLYQQGKAGLWVDPDLALAVKWQQDNQPTAAWATRYNPAFERAMAFLEYSKKESLFKIEQRAQKQANELRRARRTAIILGTASILSLLLLVFALNLKFKAESSEKRALENEKKLKIEGTEADLQKKQALLQQKIAEQQQSIAAQQQGLAEEQKLTAISERRNAELQKLVAIAQSKEANLQRTQALYQKRQADTARLAAVKSGKVAQEQRDNAIVARREVETLRMLSEARSIAFKSNQLSGDAQKDTLSMQMAFLSYVINREYGGKGQNRAIYNALKAQVNRYYSKVLRYNFGVKTNANGYDFRSVAFINNNDFFTAGDDGTVNQWTVTGSPVQIKIKKAGKSVGESITSITLSPDKKFLLGRTINGRVIIWNVNNLSTPLVLPDAAIKAQYITFLPADDDYRLFVKTDKYASIYDYSSSGYKLVNRYQLCKGPADNGMQAGGVQFKKGITNVFVAQGGQVCALTFNATGDLSAMNTVLALPEKISSIALAANGNTMAIGTDAGNIEMYSITGERPMLTARMNSHGSRVTGLSFNMDQSTLASGSLDNTVRLAKWQDQDDKGEDLIFQDRKSWVRNIAMSPNYKYILSVGQSGLMQLWPVTERIVLQELTNIADNKKIITGDLKDKEIEKEIGSDIYKRLWQGKYKNFKGFWSAMANKYINKSV